MSLSGCGFEEDHGALGINPLTDVLLCTGNSSECSGRSYVNTGLYGGVGGGDDWWEGGREESGSGKWVEGMISAKEGEWMRAERGGKEGRRGGR